MHNSHSRTGESIVQQAVLSMDPVSDVMRIKVRSRKKPVQNCVSDDILQ